MVPYLLFFSVGIVIIFNVFSFIILRHKHRSNFTSTNLPPGRIGWPVIGESLSYLSAGREGRPEKFFTDRTAADAATKVFKTSLLCEPTAVLCGATGNKFLFSNEGKLVVAWFPRSVAKLFPFSARTAVASQAEARRVRGILTHFLRPEALRGLVAVLDAAAWRHFAAEWDGRGSVAVSWVAKRFAFWTATKVFASLEEDEEIERLHGPFCAVAAGIFSVPVDLPGTTLNRAVRAADTVREELMKVVRRRKAELESGSVEEWQRRDIVSEMLVARAAEDGQGMSELDVADKTLGVLVGSHDTISAVCTLIVKFLAELPHVYTAVYNEQMKILESKAKGELLSWEDVQKMKYSWNVAQEVLRITSPAQGAFREAISDVSYGGFTIPKGWKLYWSATATHMNPVYFPDPEKFDPTRFEGSGPAAHTFVPFGGGPRMCPGREYARVKILVFMHNLIARYRWEKVFPDEKITVVLSMPTPAKGLPVRLFPHPSF